MREVRERWVGERGEESQLIQNIDISYTGDMVWSLLYRFFSSDMHVLIITVSPLPPLPHMLFTSMYMHIFCIIL